MSDLQAFMPCGKCIVVAAGAAAAAGVAAPNDIRGDSSDQNYLVVNIGSSLAYLGVGKDATDAQNALGTLPAAGAPQPAVPLPPGSCQSFTFPRGSFFSGRSPVGSNMLNIVPGRGV